MNDIEIVWIDETNIIIKCIYDTHIPPSRLKIHLDTLADSEFFTKLKSKYNVMVVGCIQKQIDTQITNNHISINEDGDLNISSKNDVKVKLEGDKKIFYVDTDLDKEEIVSKFENAMKTIE